ncbi:enoyl-CoA hydratase/isomerase family protein [Diplocloster modestus]|uniref:Enoyl-CoA hydratase/isomerase family protein n=1 Tax=Diplocloster modestus TaxID=2850322 RepID=A0ABS6K6T3_9FIRM|nr:enoyl-CoA hydratase-related protein [Diplocloster modestus]MBU9726239.1 enoyl-CoA hydratase/isomerase family protein [Diplocloster modestus]
MSENNAVLTRVEDNVLIISLNRPEIMNALDSDLVEGFIAALKRAGDDPEIGAVVLTAEGRGFCAGGYMKPVEIEITPALVRDGIVGYARDIILPMYQLEKPIIGAINGAAAGGGCNLALACDIIFASEKASFIQSFVNVGLIPDFAGLYFLPHIIGAQKAKDMMFTGRKVRAAEAQQMGLIFKALPPEEYLDAAIAYAKQLAQGPRYAIGLTKRLVNASIDYDLFKVLEVENLAQPVLSFMPDHEEGKAAFNEKRPPRFNQH